VGEAGLPEVDVGVDHPRQEALAGGVDGFRARGRGEALAHGVDSPRLTVDAHVADPAVRERGALEDESAGRLAHTGDSPAAYLTLPVRGSGVTTPRNAQPDLSVTSSPP